jgi:hypothetical protein
VHRNGTFVRSCKDHKESPLAKWVLRARVRSGLSDGNPQEEAPLIRHRGVGELGKRGEDLSQGRGIEALFGYAPTPKSGSEKVGLSYAKS